MDAGALLSQYWSFVAVAALVYVAGVVVKRIVSRFWPLPETACVAGYREAPGMEHPDVPVLRRLYDATLPGHALVVGFVFGFVPLPVPEWVGDGISRCFWFMLAGALCGQLYESIQRFARALFGAPNGRATQPPKEPAEERGGP